jgi:hypothetical protein
LQLLARSSATQHSKVLCGGAASGAVRGGAVRFVPLNDDLRSDLFVPPGMQLQRVWGQNSLEGFHGSAVHGTRAGEGTNLIATPLHPHPLGAPELPSPAVPQHNTTQHKIGRQLRIRCFRSTPTMWYVEHAPALCPLGKRTRSDPNNGPKKLHQSKTNMGAVACMAPCCCVLCAVYCAL